MKKILAFLVATVVSVGMFTGCGSKSDNDSTETTKAQNSAVSGSDTQNEELPLQGKKIAYVFNVVSTDIFQMAANAAKDTAQQLGASVDVFFTDNDNTKFQDTVLACANQKYDGLFLSHGNQESALDLVTSLTDQGIPVVCFDTQFVDNAGTNVNGTIPNVTQMFQDDQKMAAMLLDYILDMYPEKVAANEPVKILKIWRGPGIAPFDRRQQSYLEYEQAGKIETVEVIAPSDPKNGEASMTDVASATLPRYGEGDVDAIWSCYDSYARGAYVALSESGRTDIPMVSVDISNQDINYMIDGKDIWRACATVDFTTIGQQGVRILAMKMKGDETEPVYNLTPSIVTYDQLNSEANITNLGQYVSGYGINNDHIPDWMSKYIAKK